MLFPSVQGVHNVVVILAFRPTVCPVLSLVVMLVFLTIRMEMLVDLSLVSSVCRGLRFAYIMTALMLSIRVALLMPIRRFVLLTCLHAMLGITCILCPPSLAWRT